LGTPTNPLAGDDETEAKRQETENDRKRKTLHCKERGKRGAADTRGVLVSRENRSKKIAGQSGGGAAYGCANQRAARAGWGAEERRG